MSQYKISPSSSGRFLTCTASIQHNTGSGESETTLKGTLQHEVAFLKLDQMINLHNHEQEIATLTDLNNWYEGKENKAIKVQWSRDFDITVNNYIAYVKKIVQAYSPSEIMLEYKIKLNFHGEQMNGTVDCAMILENGDLMIIDLKTGRTPVKTEDNNQMLMYAYGVIQDRWRQKKTMPQNIVISIFQSLINNTNAVSYTMKEIMEWYVSKIEPMEEIKTGNLVYRPSTDACKFCQFKHKCNERIKKGVIV
jgi:hypothetical protein